MAVLFNWNHWLLDWTTSSSITGWHEPASTPFGERRGKIHAVSASIQNFGKGNNALHLQFRVKSGRGYRYTQITIPTGAIEELVEQAKAMEDA